MRLWLIILLVFACLPTLGATQSVTVRAGEHAEGFTRLVTRLPAGTQWSVTKRTDRAILTFDGFTGSFDTINSFDLITKDRVAALNTDDNRLEVVFNCACEVSAFVAQGEFVVLDIAGPGVVLPTPFIAEAQLETEKTEATETVERTTTPPRPIPLSVRNALDATRPRTPIPGLSLENTFLDRPRAPPTAAEQMALNEMKQRLARELGSAATRGVLTPRPGATLPLATPPEDPAENLEAEIEAPAPAPTTLQGAVNNMRITSSLDVPASPTSDTPQVSITGTVCVPDRELDLANWGNGDPFHAQIGPLRERLFGEFDRLDRGVAKKLVQLYLYFGFGAEAMRVINLYPSLSERYPAFAGIAEIMENDRVADPAYLRSMLECDTDIALWAVLAEETLDVPQTIDPSASLRALNKLPVHLRRFLAPALSQRWLSHGDTDATAAALRSVERLPEELAPAAKLAKANVIIDEGDTEGGTAKLEDVIDDNAPQSPEALIRLVETRLEANQPIDTETAGLVEAYAEELQETELGPDLRRAHVLALLKSGQFDRAFEAAKALGGDAETEEAIELRLHLVKEITVAAEDVVFLDHIFTQAPKDIARLRLRDKLQLAQRLLDLGFADRAQAVIATIPDRPWIPERQVLEAQIALALAQPEQAQAALIGLETDEATILRAEAKKMAGEHDQAADLFTAAERLDQAADAAWLAETLQSETLATNPLFAPVVEVAETDVAVSTQTLGMLARTDAALTESQKARAALAELLSAPALRVMDETTEEDAE